MPRFLSARFRKSTVSTFLTVVALFLLVHLYSSKAWSSNACIEAFGGHPSAIELTPREAFVRSQMIANFKSPQFQNPINLMSLIFGLKNLHVPLRSYTGEVTQADIQTLATAMDRVHAAMNVNFRSRHAVSNSSHKLVEDARIEQLLDGTRNNLARRLSNALRWLGFPDEQLTIENLDYEASVARRAHQPLVREEALKLSRTLERVFEVPEVRSGFSEYRKSLKNQDQSYTRLQLNFVIREALVRVLREDFGHLSEEYRSRLVNQYFDEDVAVD